MIRAHVSRVTLLVGRWLWLGFAAAVLVTGAYLFSQLDNFHDQAELAVRVEELYEFEEQMVFVSLGQQAQLRPPGIEHEIVAAAEIHAERYLGPLADLDDGGKSARAIESYLAGLRAISALGDSLAAGEATIEDVAISFAAIRAEASVSIHAVLSELSTRGEQTAHELRRLALLGLSLIVGGGVLSAAGLGWANHHARALSRERVEYQRSIDKMKDEFVGLASHELRTPLTGIYGFSALLADDDGTSSAEERKRWAAHIHSEAGRLTQIVEELLNVSRIESGRLQVTRDPLPFREVVDAVLRSFDGRSELHPIEVHGELEATVLGDHGKLVQVLSNLVDNAIKYSPGGGPVRIEGRAERELLHVSVSDEGLGIPAAAMGRLFERFERIPRPETENVRSAGLGLYLVREYVTQMGGSVRVSSNSGVGSTFTFTVPLDREAARKAA